MDRKPALTDLPVDTLHRVLNFTPPRIYGPVRLGEYRLFIVVSSPFHGGVTGVFQGISSLLAAAYHAVCPRFKAAVYGRYLLHGTRGA